MTKKPRSLFSQKPGRQRHSCFVAGCFTCVKHIDNLMYQLSFHSFGASACLFPDRSTKNHLPLYIPFPLSPCSRLITHTARRPAALEKPLKTMARQPPLLHIPASFSTSPWGAGVPGSGGDTAAAHRGRSHGQVVGLLIPVDLVHVRQAHELVAGQAADFLFWPQWERHCAWTRISKRARYAKRKGGRTHAHVLKQKRVILPPSPYDSKTSLLPMLAVVWLLTRRKERQSVAPLATALSRW